MDALLDLEVEIAKDSFQFSSLWLYFIVFPVIQNSM